MHHLHELADMINKMGDKASARATMKAAGVPCVPGSEGLLESFEQAQELSREMGYPVMLKATAGGGGKGMRVVWNESEIEKAFGDGIKIRSSPSFSISLTKLYFIVLVLLIV